MWWWGRRGQRRDRWQSVVDAGKPTSLAGGDLPVRLGMLERLTRGLLHDFLPENWGHTVSLRCDRGSGWVTAVRGCSSRIAAFESKAGENWASVWPRGRSGTV